MDVTKLRKKGFCEGERGSNMLDITKRQDKTRNPPIGFRITKIKK